MLKTAGTAPLSTFPQLLVALDFPDFHAAKALAETLDPKMCRLKIGKELFTRCGPGIVEAVQALGFDVFLDLKFHDIPNTCARAVSVAADLGVWMVNVHASGGQQMMETAREALANYSRRPLLIGVTVLTSMDSDALRGCGVERSAQEQVELLAQLAYQSGLDGVVSSAREVARIKSLCSPEFITVTPGIRPKNSAANDQKRTMTPEEAIAEGSDYIVVGRPITAADDPHEACKTIYNSIL